MLTGSRTAGWAGALVMAAVSATTLASSPAYAGDGYTPYVPPVLCGQSSCDLTATSPGTDPTPGASRPGSSTGNTAPGNGSSASAPNAYNAPVAAAGASDSGSTGIDFFQTLYQAGWTARQVEETYGRAPLNFDPATGQPRQWLASGREDEAAPPPAAGTVAAPAPPTPAELAQRAVSQLHLPNPVIATSPADDQVVNVPTWLWLASTSWSPVSASASVPGMTVTATAVPQSVTWSMGNGDAVTCQGPGTPYVPGSDPKSASPDCGYTYARSSFGQPGEQFTVTATVVWTVSWTGGGQAGVVPGLNTTAQTGLRVTEIQALVVEARG